MLLSINSVLIQTIISLCVIINVINSTNLKEISLPDLPAGHLIRFLNSFPKLKEICQLKTNNCKLPQENAIDDLNSLACWGHEHNCSVEMRFQTPNCPGDHRNWVQNKVDQLNTFYYQADFGYIQQQIQELTLFCTPKFITDSSLECTKYLRFCRGRNLLFDFRDLSKRTELIRYHLDVLKAGQVLGHCELNRTKLKAEMDHMSALQSWAPELRNFAVWPQPIMGGNSNKCDLIVDTPTFIMKIDATFNMYHHFCDFFNLYATLFVNQTHPLAFDTNTQIIIWETYPYDSPFIETFKAFTRNPIWTLNEVRGKRVCFRNVVLPLLPRMIFGLYYNTPIIQGCQNSGLFRAFSEFILHRLQIPFKAPLLSDGAGKIRVTFLLRRTQFRQVLNEKELLDELNANGNYEVIPISFERLNFREQLEIVRNTDILIGMHGAGLTHLLFLPNWSTLFELHNCEDPNCYKDLARLRGVNYITWESEDLVYPEDQGTHPQGGGAHAKFTNYAFDRKEFARLVAKAADHVRKHEEFKKFQNFDSNGDGDDDENFVENVLVEPRDEL